MSPPSVWIRRPETTSGNTSKELKEAHDITVVLTTHYMDEADRLSDRIAIMDHGKIVVLGYASEAQRNP